MRRIVGLANTHTQSRFEISELKKANSPTQLIILAASKLVISKFSDLSEFDLNEAFEMYAAQELATETKTYYGKFDVHVLGQILKAYKEFKNKFIFEYEKELKIEESRADDAQKEEKNNATAKLVIRNYNFLWSLYHNIQTSEDNEIFIISSLDVQHKIQSKIHHFWAKILLENNIIHFSEDQKKEIWEEAKEIAKNELAKSVTSDNYNSIQKRNFKKALEKIQKGEHEESYYLNSKRIYSELLIIKSITNGSL